jgi:hypothetical protein
MTHEVAPAVFVIHEVAAVREAIQGANATMNSIYRTDFVTPADRSADVRSDQAKGIANHGMKQSRVTGNSDVIGLGKTCRQSTRNSEERSDMRSLSFIVNPAKRSSGGRKSNGRYGK